MKHKRSQPAHVECSAGRDVRFDEECAKLDFFEKDPSKMQVQTATTATFKWATDHASYHDFMQHEKGRLRAAIERSKAHQPHDAASVKTRMEHLIRPYYNLRTKRTLVHLIRNLRSEPDKDTSDHETLRLTLLEMVPKSIALTAIGLGFDYVALNKDGSDDEDGMEEEVQEEVDDDDDDD